jgi:hypothetical protein
VRGVHKHVYDDFALNLHRASPHIRNKSFLIDYVTFHCIYLPFPSLFRFFFGLEPCIPLHIIFLIKHKRTHNLVKNLYK